MHRYIPVIDVLAALVPTLTEAVRAIRTRAFVILDSTLLPIDRIAADTPYYSEKHKPSRHERPGPHRSVRPAVVGVSRPAARTRGIIDALAATELKCWTDKAHQGVGHSVRVPLRGRRHNR